MEESEKLDKIYEMVLRLDSAAPNLVTKLECTKTHSGLVSKVNAIYLIAAAISGTFSFLGVVAGFVLKAKGMF